MVAVQLDKALADPAGSAALAELDGVLIGGGPMPAQVAEKASAAGIPVIRTYGMSETAGGCVYDGVPLDGVRVRTDGGRITLGGATLANGYRNAISPDPFEEAGWFRTDDVGTLDDHGRLRVLGRVDDAISTGGLTVMPALVEAALVAHRSVTDCAVFGVPDDRLGQRVVAAVVVPDGHAAPTVSELRALVEQTMDTTAAPREVHVIDTLPRRGIGKLDRKALAAQFSCGRTMEP
jgi:O-succinylbenzoic acid--CoA ligase